MRADHEIGTFSILARLFQANTLTGGDDFSVTSAKLVRKAIAAPAMMENRAPGIA